MSTTVSPSPNRKTWDATVRVTGGHPQQLWGIGEAQASAEGPQLRVERVLVHDETRRTLGYAQVLLRSRAERVIAETVQCHVHRPGDVPVVAGALAAWARDEHAAALLRLDPDTLRTPGAGDALTEAGFTRRGTVVAGPQGPRRLQVPLADSERDLARRLSQQTLDRCRAALRSSGVTVREVTAGSGELGRVGLRTRLIDRLLEDLGEDSLLLVATESAGGPDGATDDGTDDGAGPGESALGYLWFVHTGELAMLYRVGFTRRARDLGVDDALLLTGLVELRKRGVRALDGGDPAEPDVPLVLRELAAGERPVLGTWEIALGRGRSGEFTGTTDAVEAADAAVRATGTAVAQELGVADPVPAVPEPGPEQEPRGGAEPAGDERAGGVRRVGAFTKRLLGEGVSALRSAAGR